jgi:hypothetical protein
MSIHLAMLPQYDALSNKGVDYIVQLHIPKKKIRKMINNSFLSNLANH